MSLYDELVKWRWGFPSWKLRYKILGIFIVIALIFLKLLEIYQKSTESISSQQSSVSQKAQGDNNKQFATTGNNSPVTYIERQENYLPKSNGSAPSPDDITASGRRAAPWNNEYGGDRRSYQRLLYWKDTVNDLFRKDLIATEIERVEKSYPVDVMRLHIEPVHNPQRWWICKESVEPCADGFEPPEGFNAHNIINHLDRQLWQERGRAASILRNIKTAPNKNPSIKEQFFTKLLDRMDPQKENSLFVAKMALETYKDLTGFASNGVFDFEGAQKDWEKRKDEILKISF